MVRQAHHTRWVVSNFVVLPLSVGDGWGEDKAALLLSIGVARFRRLPRFARNDNFFFVNFAMTVFFKVLPRCAWNDNLFYLKSLNSSSSLLFAQVL